MKTSICVLVLALIIGYGYRKFYQLPPRLDGYSDPDFREAVQVYRKQIQYNVDMGSGFAVFHEGRKVLDMVGGYSDLEFELPWTAATLTQMFSLSSVSVALTAALLIQRNLTQPSDLVAALLPGFEVNGKEKITIQELLTHQARLPYFRDKISLQEYRDDPEKFFQFILKQRPVENPESPLSFHMYTLPLYMDALVRQVDAKKRTLAQFFVDEIAFPIAADIMIGLPRTQMFRMARSYHHLADGLYEALPRFDWDYLRTLKWYPLASETSLRAQGLLADYSVRLNGNPALNEVPLPATHMFANAKSLARLFTLLAAGGSLNGREVFHSHIISTYLNTSGLVKGFDSVLQRDVIYTSTGLQLETSPLGTPLVGFRDSTGQMVFADMVHNLSIAFVTNHNHASSPPKNAIHRKLIDAVYECLMLVMSKKKS